MTECKLIAHAQHAPEACFPEASWRWPAPTGTVIVSANEGKSGERWQSSNEGGCDTSSLDLIILMADISLMRSPSACGNNRRYVCERMLRAIHENRTNDGDTQLSVKQDTHKHIHRCRAQTERLIPSAAAPRHRSCVW
jgi:hypothetical protein